MLTLIRREIEDARVFYVTIFVVGLGFAVGLARCYQTDDPWPMTAVPSEVMHSSGGCLVLLMACACIFEIFQRGVDQRGKTSTFLYTLTPTRGQLLIAKWWAALIWLGGCLLPMIVVHAYFLSRAIQWGAVQQVDLLLTHLGLIVLAPISCYLLSQFLGLTCRPTVSLFVDFLIGAVVFSLIIVKGTFPGAIQQIGALLGVLSIAAGIGTWSRFQTISL